MRRLFFIIGFIIFVCSKLLAYSDCFSYKGLELSLKIEGDINNLRGTIICKNISNKKIKLPKFYLDFYGSDKLRLKNNWFSIINENGELVEYHGNFYDPILRNLNSNVIKLKPGKSFVIVVDNIEKNYEISSCKKLHISYYGPLGESNIVDFILYNDVSYN